MGISAASAEFTLGDETLTMKPLTMKQIEEINNWMQIKFLRSIRDAAEGDQEMIATGMEEMTKYNYFTKRGSAYLSTMSGIAKMLSITTSLSYDEALDRLTSNINLTSFNDVFKLLNGGGKKGKSSDPKLAAI